MHFTELKPCRRLPVDKGWAWVVLMASSVILIIVQGSIRTFGLFIVELQRIFQTSSTKISILLAAESISICLSSFLAMNCLSNILSSRTLIIIGSLLSALCFILDSVASTPLMLPFFHLLSGAGIAFAYGPCLVNINHYFKRYRGTANALASCGSSIGQFLFSPLRIVLLFEYGVNGALLVNSALFLQCIVFAMLLRPINYFENKSCKGTYSSVMLSCRNCDEINREKFNEQRTDPETEIHENVDANILNANSEQEEKKSLLMEGKVLTGTKTEKTKYKAEKKESDLHSVPNNQLVDNEKSKQDEIICSRTEIKKTTSVSVLPSMNKDFIHKKQNPKWRQLLLNVDFRLFKEKNYVIYFFGAAIGQIASSSPQNYFPTHAEDIGLTQKEGAFFVAIAGFADLGGRILTTLIADRKCLNKSRFLGLVLLSHGIIGCFIPLGRNLWAFSAYCIYYGVSGGILFALLPTILVDFIGEHRLSQGLGLMYLFTGLLATLYYPVFGYIRDLTESYDVGYVLNSVALIVSGILFLSEACIKYKKSPGSDN